MFLNVSKYNVCKWHVLIINIVDYRYFDSNPRRYLQHHISTVALFIPLQVKEQSPATLNIKIYIFNFSNVITNFFIL